MTIVSVSELKANLSGYLREAHRGGEKALVIADSKSRQPHGEVLESALGLWQRD